MVGIAVEAVKRCAALSEVDIDAGRGEGIRPSDRIVQLSRIYRDFGGELTDRLPTNEQPLAFTANDIAGPWMDRTEPVFIHECRIADEVRRNAWDTPISLEHGQDKIVIRHGFIDESGAVCVHRNQTRFRPIEQKVGIEPIATIAAPNDRDRCPECAAPMLLR